MRQEQVPNFCLQEEIDFGSLESGFDINAAFQEAMSDVATTEEIVLEEKVRRMEVIVTESSSEVYRNFVDFRSIAAQMEMYCNHDHALNQATQGNEKLTGFMDIHGDGDGHNHKHSHNKKSKKEDGEEIDPKTRKKKKKKRSWFGIYV